MNQRARHADWALIGRQSLAATLRRPGRSLVTAIGVALGVGVFLVTVGWSQTVSSQINQTFDELAATQLRIRDTQADTSQDSAMPDDFEERIAQIIGVVAGGRIWEVGKLPVAPWNGADDVTLPILAIDPGTFMAARAHTASGRTFDASAPAAGLNVAVLGSAASAALGVTTVTPGSVILIDGRPVALMGVLEPTPGAPELDNAVLVPTTAPLGPGEAPPAPSHMTALVQVELGAAAKVANQVPLAVRPDAPSRLGVMVPPSPTSLRSSIQGSLNTLAYGAATLSLLIGAIGIMNAMLMAVTQRSGEIGLRRALGAARRHVTVQFILEGALLGLLGAIVGTVAGECALIALAWANDSVPVLDRGLLLAAPLTGILLGACASLHPALRAAKLDPATTLRGSV